MDSFRAFIFPKSLTYTLLITMKNMKPLIILAAISICLWGCNQSTENNSNSHKDHHGSISLNEGEKWIVDSAMIVHIRNIEQDILDYKQKDSNQYSTLAAKLQNHLDLLTSNCTMKGQAHDELHKWLVPFMQLVDDLLHAETDEASTFKDIEDSIATFNTYFK